MPMRRPTRETATSRFTPIDEFGWELPLILTLRHSTLPWGPDLAPLVAFDAVPLARARPYGERDRLSLVAQYAAHQAFLRFAGVPDGGFDAGEWGVVRRRGSDCRLLRLSARMIEEDDEFSLERIETMAEFLGVDRLEPLERAWGKPESVFRAIDRRIRANAGDRTWLRAAALGQVLSPDAASLRAMAVGAPAFVYADDAVSALLASAAQLGKRFELVVLGGGSPLQRDSSLAALAARVGPVDGLHESEIVERFLGQLGSRRAVFLLRDVASLDERARLVIHLLSGATAASPWLVPPEGVEILAPSRSPRPLPGSRIFVLSERLVPRVDLERVLDAIDRDGRFRWLEEFVRSDAYSAFLEEGVVPEEPVSALIRQVGEPRRSYLAALALVGERAARATAVRFLKQLGCKLDIDDLLVDGLTALHDHELVFATRAVQHGFARLVPADSAAGLCRLAAALIEEGGDPFRCAALWEKAGDRARAIAILEARIDDAPHADRLVRLRETPRALIAESSALSKRLVDALLAAGRYLEAHVAAEPLPHDDRSLARARVERRLGNYAAAEAELRAIGARDFDAELLLAEILRLQGKFDDAESCFAACAALGRSSLDRVRAGYERALLALDLEEVPETSWISDETPAASYYSSRFRAYAAVDRGAHAAAIEAAAHAAALAPDLACRIDAELDLVYAQFLAGNWDEARHVAHRALALIEETEGDRAAGGVLFTLAYLSADAGQWNVAARSVERLRRFYASRGDTRRGRELDLIAAQSALTRCAFDQARRIATALLVERIPPEMREAAALIVDEAGWVEGIRAPLVSSGRSACRELRERHALMRQRAGGDPAALPGGFNAALAKWERAYPSRKRAALPATSSRSEKLRLLRSLVGHAGPREEIARLAERCGVELGAREHAAGAGSAAELAALRAAATAEFPFGARDLGDLRWRFVTRNRLGHFSEIGSPSPLSPRELESIPFDDGGDWTACGENGWLYVEGLARWSPSSREALASIVRVRSEHVNLKRAAEQEEMIADATPKSVDGILGSSPAIADVVGLVLRLARTDVPICVLGESGTGKELIARAVHRNSSRRSKPFTPVNCAALPENLVESELFGHVRGAFTGADRDRAGLIETTDGGTLFLDEIGELPSAAQAKLLRFLQEGEFRRVGDTATRTADVRIVAATNRKLENAVDDGSFREDLYYRIRGVEVNVPPLRERGSDIVVLARHFLAREREKQRFGPDRFLPEVEAVFLAYRWPGNIRELHNAVRAAFAIAGDARQVRLEHLPERLRGVVVTRTRSGSLYDELNQFRKRLIERSLAESQGNQSQAAKRLGISRQALAYQIRELGILVG